MKSITSKSAGDWATRWKVFMWFGLAITGLISAGAVRYGNDNFFANDKIFGFVGMAYFADGAGLGEIKIPKIDKRAREIVSNLEPAYQARPEFRRTVQIFLWSPVIGYSLSLTSLLLIGRLMRRNKNEDEHLRGAELSDVKKLRKMLRGKPSNFDLGGVPIPVHDEPQHFLFCGGTGSGKTLAFRRVLSAIKDQDQRAIIADPGGEFLRAYWREGDSILNPFDERSAAWSPFAEMRGGWDAERLAKSIIPDGRGQDAEWNLYAQQLLSGVLERLWSKDNVTNGELVRILTIAESSEIRELVAGLPAQRMFEAGNEKFLASVLSIVSSYARPLAWLNPAAGQDGFSIRRWVEKESCGCVYITYRDDQLAALRPLIAAWVDVTASSILTLPENSKRRIWLALDEFAGLGKVQSIEPFLTKARKAGGCAILGLQSISQLHDTYGSKKAETLLSCLGTWLVLRQSDPQTAEAMSLYLGDREVLRQSESGSKGGDGSGSWLEQVVKSRLIMPAELQRLESRRGYLSLLGNYPVCPIEMPIPDKQPEAAPAFVLCEQKTSAPSTKQPGNVLNFEGW